MEICISHEAIWIGNQNIDRNILMISVLIIIKTLCGRIYYIFPKADYIFILLAC